MRLRGRGAAIQDHADQKRSERKKSKLARKMDGGGKLMCVHWLTELIGVHSIGVRTVERARQ